MEYTGFVPIGILGPQSIYPVTSVNSVFNRGLVSAEV